MNTRAFLRLLTAGWAGLALPAGAGAQDADAIRVRVKEYMIAFLVLIVWNLGAGLYYMLTDRGESKRTVNALTKRIALSVALILLVALAIWAGWIEPHGVGG